MFCPNCRLEYEKGVTRCSDCDRDLVDELPGIEPPDYVEFVTVLRTGNPAHLAVAKSMLDDAGIEYFAKGEELQDLFGMGRFGTGFNVLTGPVELQVDAEKEAEARALLGEIIQEDEAGG